MNQVLEKITFSEARRLIFILFFSLAGPSLPAMSAFYISGDLGGSVNTISYGVAFSLLGILVTKPFGIILARNIGRLKLLKICLLGNLVTTILMLINTSYFGYLVIWFFHGMATGPVYLLIITSVRKYVENEKVLHYTKFILASLIIAPTFGAAIGAIISYQYSWRWSFFLFCIFYCICIYFLFTTFNKGEYPLEYTPIDWVGYVFYALGIIALGFCLTVGLLIDGFRSTVFNVIFTIGILCFTYFWIRNHFLKSRIIEYRISKVTFKLCLMVAIALLIFAFHFAIIVLMSHWLHLYVSYSLKWIGWILSANILGALLLPFIFKYSSSKFSYTFLTFSLLLTFLICLYVSRFNVDINLSRIILARFLSGIAIAIFMPSAIMQVLSCCNQGCDYWGIGLFTLSKSTGSFIGIAFFSLLWEKRSTFFHSRLGGSLTQASQNTQSLLNHLNEYNFSSLMKLEGLSEALSKQSRALALDDCFMLVAIFMSILIVILILYIVYEKIKESKGSLQDHKV